MLKDQSYVSVSGTGVLDVDGRLEVNVKVRARTKMERFFSQNGTSVADRGTPRPLIVLSKWNNGRTKLERPSLKTELASFSL